MFNRRFLEQTEHTGSVPVCSMKAGGVVMLQKGEGIVIRTMDYGETHKIIRLYTREQGKVACMARGAKKTHGHLVAVSQLFSYGYYMYYIGSGLGTLQQGEVIDYFSSLQADIYRTAYASYIVELLDKLTYDGQANPFLFELAYQSLHDIDDGVDPEVIAFIFATKMLAVAGIQPYVDGCLHCGRTETPFVFSVREGGLLCKNCETIDPEAIPLADASAKLLRVFAYMDIKRLGKVSLHEATRRQLRHVLATYYDEHSGLNLKSKRFLEQLQRMEP